MSQDDMPCSVHSMRGHVTSLPPTVGDVDLGLLLKVVPVTFYTRRLLFSTCN